MRWFITLLFMILVAVGGAALLIPDRVLPAVGLGKPAAPPSLVTADMSNVSNDAITKIELTRPGQPPLVFEKANGIWTQPGGWGLRQDEVNELVAVTHLHTRFVPLPLTGDGAEFGLAPAQKPVTMTVSTGAKTRTFTFGVPKPSPDEPAFARPTFVRLGGGSDVLRVGPEVYATVTRPADRYLRRQLFGEVKREQFNTPATPGQTPRDTETDKLYFADGVESIAVAGPAGKYTLTRFQDTPPTRRDPNDSSTVLVVLPTDLAHSWKLTAPTEDRIDPAKLQTILTALPDLWVERFFDPDPLADLFTDYLRVCGPSPVITAVLQQSDRSEMRREVSAKLTGFTREEIERRKKAIEAGKSAGNVWTFPAERVVTVTPTDHQKPPVTLRIGAVSRVESRKEPGPMGAEIRTEYRFAKFEGHPRVFEVKADKLPEVFVAADALADPKLVRFNADEVAAVTVTPPREFPAAAIGGWATFGDKPLSQVTLTRVKGKPTAPTEKGKKDRWFLGDRLAEASEVTALVDALTKLEAKTAADRPYAIAPPGVATTVTVQVEPKVAEGDTPLPTKTVTFRIGGRDPITNKLGIAVEGWARLNWIDPPAPAGPMAPPPGPPLDQLALRPAATYRGKQLFDTADSSLDRIAVKADASAFLAGMPAAFGGLAGVAPPPVPTGFEAALPPAETKWELVAPVSIPADDTAAPKLATDLADLKAVTEVTDAPTDTQLAEFGLTRPRLTVTLGFRGTDARTETLTLGRADPDTGDVYARRNATGGVFTIPNGVVESLTAGAESLLPKQVWTVAADTITALGVKRGDTPDDTYTLAKVDAEAKKWTLVGPFTVSADGLQAEALAAAVAGLKATRYELLNAPAATRARYGLEKPAVRLTVTTDAEKKISTRTLLIGHPTTPGGAERFAKLDTPNAPVFVIPDAAFAAADKSAVAYLDRKLLAIDPTKLTKIQLTSPTPETAVTLVFDGKTWKPEGTAFPVDEPTIFSLVNAVTRLTALKIVAYGKNVEAAKYGFDKPPHAVTLTVTDEPAPVVIQLGKEEPTGERYVRVEGQPAVGLLSGFAVAALTKGKLDIIDRGMMTFDPQLVTSIARTMGKDDFALAPAGRGWEVTKPKTFKADTPMVESLIGEVGFLRAVKVAAFAPADRKPFGLDPPAAVVTFKGDGKDRILRVGKPVNDAKPEEGRYAAVAGSQVVAVIPTALGNKLLAEPVKFSDRTLNPNRFVDADKVVLTRDGRTATFAKVAGVWKMTAPVEAPAETAAMEDLIAAAAQLRADELVVNDPPPEKLKELGFDPPQGRIVISYDGKELLNLLVGAKEKAGPRVPVKLATSGLIGLLDAANSAKVTAEYRARAAWPAVDAAQVDVLAVSGNGGFAFRKTDPTTWVDTAMPNSPVDGGKVAEAVAVLAGLKAERYVADKDAKLVTYGLEKPNRVIVLTLKGGESRVLHLGSPVGGPKGKQVYAKVADKDRTDVFILSEADTAQLTADRKAFGK